MELSERDRISELPEHIRQHILSFLCYKEAVATSILSTTWKFDWLCIDSLKFDTLFYRRWRRDRVSDHYTKALQRASNQELRAFPFEPSYWGSLSSDAHERYTDFLKRTLLRTEYVNNRIIQRKFKKLQLDLWFDSPNYLVSLLNDVIVEELQLSISFCYASYRYFDDKLMEFLLTSQSLIELHLEDCTLPCAFPCEPKLSNLRKLSLFNVRFYQDVFDIMIANCTNLESLSIDMCKYLMYLQLLGFHNLKTLNLVHNKRLEKVEMDCPKLQNFKYVSKANLLLLKGITSVLATVELVCNQETVDHDKFLAILDKIGNSKHLSLTLNDLKDVIKLLKLRQPNSSPLYEIKHLEISCYYLNSDLLGKIVEVVVWLCPRLKTLQFNTSTVHIQFRYKEPTNEKCGCYASLPIDCWRHSVTDFVIEKNLFRDNNSIEEFFNNVISGENH